MKSWPLSISSFKALALRVVLPLLLIAVVGLPVLDHWVSGTVIVANNKTRTYKMHRLFNELHESEIPMFGSSTVYRGFLPDSLGPQFYNYGMYGSNFQKVRLLLEQELSKPKTTPIILDWHPKWLSYRDSVPIQMADYLPQTHHPRVKEFLQRHDYDKVWNTVPGVRYFGYFEEYVGQWARRDQLPAKFGFNRGCKYFKAITHPDKMAQFVDQRLKIDMHFGFDDRLKTTLEALIAAHPDRIFVLVASPLHESVQRAGGNLEPLRAYLHELEARTPNVVGLVYDGATYSDDYFLDTMHLNGKGAKRFSAELRQELKARKIIQ